MNNCLIKIKESMDLFSKKEKKIAKYILENPLEVSRMTVDELAKNSKVSTATIVRFCYTLGHKGYKEFSRYFYHSVVDSLETKSVNIVNLPVEKTDFAQTIQKVSNLNIEAIQNSVNVLDYVALEKTVDLILAASKVYIYAIGGSAVVAADFVFKLQRIGIDCQYFDAPHSQIFSAGILKDNDIALFISYSGETKDLLKTARIVKKTPAKSIAISRFGDNSLSRLVDVNIHHSSVGQEHQKPSTQSRIAQLNITDIIFTFLTAARKEDLNKFFELTDETI